jgi:hypothetical protein
MRENNVKIEAQGIYCIGPVKINVSEAALQWSQVYNQAAS